MTDALLDKIAKTENLLQLRVDLADIDRRKYFAYIKEQKACSPHETPDLARIKRAWKKKSLFVEEMTKRLDTLADFRSAAENMGFDGEMTEIFELYHKTTGRGLANLAVRGKAATDNALRTGELVDEVSSMVSAPIQKIEFNDSALEEELEELMRTEQDIVSPARALGIASQPRIPRMGPGAASLNHG